MAGKVKMMALKKKHHFMGSCKASCINVLILLARSEHEQIFFFVSFLLQSVIKNSDLSRGLAVWRCALLPTLE